MLHEKMKSLSSEANNKDAAIERARADADRRLRTTSVAHMEETTSLKTELDSSVSLLVVINQQLDDIVGPGPISVSDSDDREQSLSAVCHYM